MMRPAHQQPWRKALRLPIQTDTDNSCKEIAHSTIYTIHYTLVFSDQQFIMSAMNFSSAKQFVRPPERGVFPLDHDSECRPFMEVCRSYARRGCCSLVALRGMMHRWCIHEANNNSSSKGSHPSPFFVLSLLIHHIITVELFGLPQELQRCASQVSRNVSRLFAMSNGS